MPDAGDMTATAERGRITSAAILNMPGTNQHTLTFILFTVERSWDVFGDRCTKARRYDHVRLLRTLMTALAR
jgi:hypothetical protein